jgi:hypothetical protein
VSSGDHGAVRVETGIYRRKRGTYRVEVMRDYVTYRRTFKTLDEARRFRDGIRSGRMSVTGGMYAASDVVEERQCRRQAIRVAPRSKQVIDGREFTVVSLPDVNPGAPTTWDTLSLRQVA